MLGDHLGVEVARPPTRGDHRAPAVVAHIRLQRVLRHVLLPPRRVVPGGRRPRLGCRSSVRPRHDVRVLEDELLPPVDAHRERDRYSPTRPSSRSASSRPWGSPECASPGRSTRNPDEVVHPSFPNRNYMEVLGGAGSWVATPADVVKIVDSLDNTKPGFHPLAGRPRPADAQAGGRHRLPVDAGAVVRAGDDGIRQPVVGAHGNDREHPRDGRPPARRDDVVDPRQRQLSRGHARSRGDLPGRPRPIGDRRPGADDVDHDDDLDDNDDRRCRVAPTTSSG